MRVLVNDLLFPNKFAKWRIEEIKSFIEKYETDILCIKYYDQDFNVGDNFNWEELYESHHLSKYDILIFEENKKGLQKYNSPDFDGTKYIGKYPGSYLLRLKKYRNVPFEMSEYESMYHIFIWSYLLYQKSYPQYLERQMIHLYPGGGCNTEELYIHLYQIPPQIKLVLTQSNVYNYVSGCFNNKIIKNVYGATYLQKDTPKRRKKMLSTLSFGVCFTSLGHPIEKGYVLYEEIVKMYVTKYPDDEIEFNACGNCDEYGKLDIIKYHSKLPQKELDEFYHNNIDVYLNLHQTDTFQGFPLGTEAVLQGSVLITSDMCQNNQGNGFNLTDDDGIFIRDPKNTEQIMKLIKCLYDDRIKCYELGMKAQDKAYELFSYENQQQKIFDFIENKTK